MKKLLTLLYLLTMVCLFPGNTNAQMPGYDWEEVWVIQPPTTASPTNPYYWMYGNCTYTGLAYDKWNDVVYVVNPDPTSGPRIFALNAETGVIDSSIQHASQNSPAGQLFVDPSVVSGGFVQGRYGLYKIDLDDQGRIYASNFVAPVFGVCFPGPPPDCDPDFSNQGPFKVYRWDSAGANPECIYSSPVGDLPQQLWGTALDVVGCTHALGEQQVVDSTRIYTTSGNFYTGYTHITHQVACLIEDTSAVAATKFRLGARLTNGFAESTAGAHGIAVTGASPDSPIYLGGAPTGTSLYTQPQSNAPYPQDIVMQPIHTIPSAVTGNNGALAYHIHSTYHRPLLVVANGLQLTLPGSQTQARVVDLGTEPNWTNWPTLSTPQFGTSPYNNITGVDNWIVDVDVKQWFASDPTDKRYGIPQIQVFVLMSNNGIACYRTKFTWPVELQTFTGTFDEKNIVLNWTTASETSNKGFEIYRSFDAGNTWDMIGFTEGNGTTHTSMDYSFNDPVTDFHTKIGYASYRLKQIDFDGTYEWSPSIDISLSEVPVSMTLDQNYPNPFNPSTTIRYHLAEDAFVTLTICNVFGDVIETLVQESTGAGMHVVTYNANALPSGTYVYRLTANGTTISKKMVLMK